MPARGLLLAALLSGCAGLVPRDQVAVPGAVTLPYGARITVQLETAELMRCLMSDAEPRPGRLGFVVYVHWPL